MDVKCEEKLRGKFNYFRVMSYTILGGWQASAGFRLAKWLYVHKELCMCVSAILAPNIQPSSDSSLSLHQHSLATTVTCYKSWSALLHFLVCDLRVQFGEPVLVLLEIVEWTIVGFGVPMLWAEYEGALTGHLNYSYFLGTEPTFVQVRLKNYSWLELCQWCGEWEKKRHVILWLLIFVISYLNLYFGFLFGG